jgi:hypothetical protein
MCWLSAVICVSIVCGLIVLCIARRVIQNYIPGFLFIPHSHYAYPFGIGMYPTGSTFAGGVCYAVQKLDAVQCRSYVLPCRQACMLKASFLVVVS